MANPGHWQQARWVINIGRSMQQSEPSGAESTAMDTFIAFVMTRRTWLQNKQYRVQTDFNQTTLNSNYWEKAKFVVAIGRDMKKIVPNYGESQQIKVLIDASEERRLGYSSPEYSGDHAKGNLIGAILDGNDLVCSPSVSPSASPTISPSASPTTSPSSTPSPSSSPSTSPSGTPSVSPSGTPSSSPSTSPSGTPSVSPSGTPSASVSASPSSTPSPSYSASPSISPSASPSGTPSVSPSASPSATASASPSTSPSGTPSASPST